MDKTKHTVTIPIEDYNELLNSSNNIDIAKKHFELLYREGIEVIGGMNLTKTPINAIVSYSNFATGSRASVKFIY